MLVVVFDEPAAMTKAKLAEQMRRDASRAHAGVRCSEDRAPKLPDGDDYTVDDVRTAYDVHLLKQNRSTRNRFIDEVFRVLFQQLAEQMARWRQAGHAAGDVLRVPSGQQDDRRHGPLEELCGALVDLAQPLRRLDCVDHESQRLAPPVLALPEPLDCGLVVREHHEMEPTEALHRDDLAAPDRHRRAR